jgi:hypothetical protein
MSAKGGGPGTGEAVDVDRAPDGDVLHLRMLRVPRLDREPVDEPAPEVADDGCVGIGVQVAVPLEAVEQNLETLAEVPWAEVRRPGLGDGFLE